MPARKPQGKPQARRAPPKSAPTLGIVHPAFVDSPLSPVVRYRVLIAGISRVGREPLWQGAIATADEIGDAARVAKLLELKRIEVVTDD